ncbi:MAG: LCP family protein [Clostridia bacterium]|nr:LCP family protein [Clostridia bacterium]
MAGRGNTRRPVWGLCFLAALAALAIGAYFVGRQLEADVAEPRSQMTEGFGKYEEKIFQGNTYYKKTGITTLLLVGTDTDITAEQYLYRDGGRADFLLLLVIDHEAKTVRQLQIERYTMARVHMLTILGDDGGHMNMQICLSHIYGKDQKACAENTVEAVSHYLDNLGIDLYMVTDYSAVSEINDMLGGVTVTLQEDFGRDDMKPGMTLTLKGDQAERFVRGRMGVGDGTNASRQLRQREWLTGARKLMSARIKENPNFFGEMMDRLGSRLVTNVSRGRLINEFNAAFGYDIRAVEQIPGEYNYAGRTGSTEYYTTSDDVSAWIVDAFYRPAKQ